jgi:hypothetical protein
MRFAVIEHFGDRIMFVEEVIAMTHVDVVRYRETLIQLHHHAKKLRERRDRGTVQKLDQKSNKKRRQSLLDMGCI